MAKLQESYLPQASDGRGTLDGLGVAPVWHVLATGNNITGRNRLKRYAFEREVDLNHYQDHQLNIVQYTTWNYKTLQQGQLQTTPSYSNDDGQTSSIEYV